MSQPTPLPIDLAQVAQIPGITTEKPKPSGFWSSNPLFSFLNNTYENIAEHRRSLNLTNPGTMENLNKEVTRDVFLNQYFFTGLRADLNKAFSMNPAFQTSHTFSIGSQSIPPYAFSALYATDTFFAQGNIDNDFSLSGRLNYGWDKHNISKATLQIVKGQPTMIQLEQDYQASDFSLNLKALNPSFLDDGNFSGVAVGSILQSITPKLSVGLETVYSAQPTMPGDAAVSYYTRYDAGNWVASAQLQAQGSVVASFWRKVADNVEAGIETQLATQLVPVAGDALLGQAPSFKVNFDGTTTIGAKYEFRQSVFRGQVDSTGKVSAFLERRILPTVSVLFCGEIDQSKYASKIGMGLTFETAGSEQLALMQQGLIDANGNPVPGAPQI
jgi:mitochondrial import receptor subunit TOM40